MSEKAFVTLLTTPSYLPGVLVLLHSLLDLHPAPRDFKIVCLVTPETVDAKTIGEVRKAGFDLVIGVEPIGSGVNGQDALSLMGRPDLNLALTKLHLFRLHTLFHTLIYLDADVLPLRTLSHLFDTTHPHILSACPDTGWPDCFNSGVMVIRPRESDFEGMRGLIKAAAESAEAGARTPGGVAGGNGSFDGADQGLLNEWFSEEGGGGDWNRLSFTYNVTPSAAYQYAPAYKRYGHKISAVHFIGQSKPWSNIQYRPAGISNVEGKEGVFDYPSLIDRWYAIYDSKVRSTAAHAPDIAARFTVPETLAVWNQSAPTGGIPQQPADRMDLDALKAATQFGFAGAKSGAYTSIPLDGRVDLLMPKPAPKLVKQVSFAPSTSPAPAEAAYTQQAQAYHPPASPTIHHSPARAASPPPLPAQQEEQQRSMWDASRYSPPKEGPPEMANAQISYYENAWDKPATQQSSYFSAPPPPQQHTEPQYPTLPANVVNDSWYSHFTSGPKPDSANLQQVFPWEAAQQQRKPARVFPKGSEPPQQQQQQSNSHLQVNPSVTVQQPTPPGQVSPPPEKDSPPSYSPPPQPQSLSEAMASYRNAWDTDVSIQKYISMITGVPMQDTQSVKKTLQSVPSTPKLSPTDKEGRSRELSVSVETRSNGSGDGDDEDEGDAEEDGPRPRAHRSRGSSDSVQGRRNPRYRDRFVQTDRPPTIDVGAQWAGMPDPPASAAKPSEQLLTKARAAATTSTVSTSTSMSPPLSSSRSGAPNATRAIADGSKASGSGSNSDSTVTGRPAAGSAGSAGPAASSQGGATLKPRRIPFPVSQPSTDRIPRRTSTSHTSPVTFTSTLPTGVSPTKGQFSMGGYSGGPVGIGRGSTTAYGLTPAGNGNGAGNGSGSGSARPSPLYAHGRRTSADVPTSATGAVAESDGLTAAGEPKTKASRTFDPATDIDVRKRDTQEVLTRFMRGAGAATK